MNDLSLESHTPTVPVSSRSTRLTAGGAAPFMAAAQRPEAVMCRGQGSYLWDEAGRRYLDVVQGWATNALGHSPPELLAALAEQSSLLINPSPAYYNRPAIELVRLLASLTGAARVALFNSGAEANETAIKLARKWGRKHKRGAFGIISTSNSFHGRTLAAMAASGKPGWEKLFPPYPAGFCKVPYGDLAAVEAALEPESVALLVEPIQGEAGVVVPPQGYLRGLRELADRHQLLLILDEVQTGLGRTGTFLAAEHEHVRADITTLGKGLGGGLPVSAVLCNERADCFELGDIGSTHGGNPLLAEVGLAMCRILSSATFLAGVRRRGTLLETALLQTVAGWGNVHWRGRGLLQALVLEQPVAPAVVEAAHAHGLLLNAARPNVLRLMPQLRISGSEISELCTRLAAAWAAVQDTVHEANRFGTDQARAVDTPRAS
jgi:acetylornithine/N-succinyldiaminopimelate aminotransferase